MVKRVIKRKVGAWLHQHFRAKYYQIRIGEIKRLIQLRENNNKNSRAKTRLNLMVDWHGDVLIIKRRFKLRVRLEEALTWAM